MRRGGRWARVALAGLACAAGAASAQVAAPRAATLKLVQGEVGVFAGDTRREATAGGPVMEGERILTGSSGGASLVLRDGTVVAVGPQSTFELARFRFDGVSQRGEMALSLLRGTARFITGLIAKANPESVSIRTSTLTLGIRGTDFILEENE